MKGLPSNVIGCRLKELASWRRVAIVSDVEKIRHFTLIERLWNISR